MPAPYQPMVEGQDALWLRIAALPQAQRRRARRLAGPQSTLLYAYYAEALLGSATAAGVDRTLLAVVFAIAVLLAAGPEPSIIAPAVPVTVAAPFGASPVTIEKPGILIVPVPVPPMVGAVMGKTRSIPSGLSIPGRGRLHGREHHSRRERRKAAGAN
jgi:hypothetical protein